MMHNVGIDIPWNKLPTSVHPWFRNRGTVNMIIWLICDVVWVLGAAETWNKMDEFGVKKRSKIPNYSETITMI